jgi:putative adenylate-forming enzyme
METTLVKRGSASGQYIGQPDARERVQALAAEMLARDRWPRAELLAWQRARLRELLQHAVAKSPYYREMIGVTNAHEARLSELPILTKATLMQHFDEIVVDRRLRLHDLEEHLAGEYAADSLFGEYRVVGSGGTTGRRGVVVYDQRAWETAVAEMLRILAVQGISAQTRAVGIGAPTPLHLTNRLFAELRGGRSDEVPRLTLTTPIAEVIAALNAYQPEAIITYPSFIRRLADESRAGRLRIAPRKLCSVAESLTPDVRKLARETWGAPVLDGYGSTEAGVMAVECSHASGLHVFEDQLVLEVVDEHNRPVPAGVAGHKVLVTNLFNRTLPLIRYELSDLVVVAEGPCPCGVAHLRLASINGRREDILNLTARDGGRVSVHAFLLGETLLHIPAIRQYQLSSRSDGLLVRVVLRDSAVAIKDAVESARHAISTELSRLGAIVPTITVLPVDQIDRVGSGAKQRLLVND